MVINSIFYSWKCERPQSLLSPVYHYFEARIISRTNVSSFAFSPSGSWIRIFSFLRKQFATDERRVFAKAPCSSASRITNENRLFPDRAYVGRMATVDCFIQQKETSTQNLPAKVFAENSTGLSTPLRFTRAPFCRWSRSTLVSEIRHGFRVVASRLPCNSRVPDKYTPAALASGKTDKEAGYTEKRSAISIFFVPAFSPVSRHQGIRWLLPRNFCFSFDLRHSRPPSLPRTEGRELKDAENWNR